jgi:O-antigen ligase
VRHSPALDRVLVYALAATAFGIPLFLWPGVTEYGYAKTVFAIVAVSVLSTLRGFAAWRQGSWRVRIPWVTLPAVGFCAVAAISLVGAVNGRVGVQSLVVAVFFLQFFLLVVDVTREQRDVHLLLGAALVSGFLVSMYALLQYLGVVPGADGVGIGAITSTLGNRNFVGGFLGYLLLPSFVLIYRVRSRWLRAAALGLISSSFGVLLLVQQAGPLLGLLAGGVVVLIGLVGFRPVDALRKNRVWLAALVMALAVAYLVVPAGSPGLSEEPSDEVGGWIAQAWSKNHGRQRELNWWVAWEMFKEHPVTGVGLGNYKLLYLEHRSAFLSTATGEPYLALEIPRAVQAHNEYVQVAAELGSLGLGVTLAFLTLLGLSVWKRLRRSKRDVDRLDLLLLSGGVVVFLVHALVSFPAHVPTSALAALLLVGLIHARVYGDDCVISRRIGVRGVVVTFAPVVAIGVLASALAVLDLSANIAMGKGVRQLEAGLPADAKTSFERSLVLDFAPRQTYYYLAAAQTELGQIEEALENLELCFTRAPEEPAYLMYADVASRLGMADQARRSIAILLASNPPRAIRARAMYLEAQIEYTDGEREQAILLLKRLLEVDPSYLLAHRSLGGLLLEVGSPSDARTHLEAALALIDQEIAETEARPTSALSPLSDAPGYLSSGSRLDDLQRQREYVLKQLLLISEAESPVP